MIVYSVEFPARRGATFEEVLRIARRWLTGGPNYPWSEDDLPKIPHDEVATHTKGGQELQWGMLCENSSPIAGFRHRWIEKESLEWCTEIVSRAIDGMLWVAVRVSCEAVLIGRPIPSPRRPVLLRLLLAELSGGNDGPLKVTSTPHFIPTGSLELTSTLMRGDAGNRLPVIYISVDEYGHPYVDPVNLSQTVAGLAHVVVEPDRDFSFALRESVNGINAYGGAIGVYWPQGAGAHTRLLPGSMASGEMEAWIADQLRRTLCTIRPLAGTTWASVQEAVTRRQTDLLKKSGETDVAKYIEAFDSDLRAKERLINEAQEQIGKLAAEIRALRHSKNLGSGLLNPGNEGDLFAGEIREIICESLQRQRVNIDKDSRAGHIIDDILAANPIQEQRKKNREIVKRCLADGSSPSAKIIDELEELGFTITSDGKHHKAVFGGDGRYTFSLAKTPGDHRSGLNTASEINKMLFN